MMDYIVKFLLSLNSLLGGELGLTLIVVGVGVRIVFQPIIKKQLAHSKKMQELQPKLKDLKKKCGDDKQRFAKEQMQLFQDNGVNPAAGCLPMIVQMGGFIILYRAILRLFDEGLRTQFLVWDLAKPDVIPVDWLPFALPGVLILLAAASQLLMSKMMVPQPVAVNKEDKKKEVKEKTDLAEDLQSMQGTMIYMFPLMFIFFGYKFPAGLSLYWASSTVMALFQQYKFHGLGGLEPWVAKIRGKSSQPALALVSEKKNDGFEDFAKALNKTKKKKKGGKKKRKK